MKFIKVFDKNNDYLSYRNGKGYTKPNVSLSRDTKEVHYNYPIWDANNKSYVDLGLPSGTLWATMNVGASKPSDYGQYFQWGDTQGHTADQGGSINEQKYFGWADYKFSINGSSTNFSKYTTSGATLDLEDDAAHVNMDGDWHMPSPKQIKELIDNTTSEWTTQDGVNGRLFTSKTNTSKSIFIPAAGYASGGSVQYNGSEGYVWCTMLAEDNSSYGLGLYLGSETARPTTVGIRSCGFSIRGVLG